MTVEEKTKVCNGVDMDVLWKAINTVKDDPEMGKSKFRVENRWIKGAHSQSTVSDFYAVGQENPHKHQFMIDSDEPSLLAGEDCGANPVEQLLSSLAACISTGMVYHAATQGIEIEEIESHLEGEIDLRGFMGLSDDVRTGYQNIRMTFKVKTDSENMEKLKSFVEFSPVLDVIRHGTSVELNFEHM
jgi:uncharacterized OsmC-like protein